MYQKKNLSSPNGAVQQPNVSSTKNTKKLKGKAVLVDGENTGPLNSLLFYDEFYEDAIRKFYTTTPFKKEKRNNNGYFFDLVQTPNIGKESVDRVVAMDMVNLYHKGVKEFYLVSSDYDFGDTAAHFKTMFPKASVTIVADPNKINVAKYKKKLDKYNINYQPFTFDQKESFAYKVLSTVRKCYDTKEISLNELGRALHRHQVEYKRGYLKKEIVKAGLDIDTENDCLRV